MNLKEIYDSIASLERQRDQNYPHLPKTQNQKTKINKKIAELKSKIKNPKIT